MNTLPLGLSIITTASPIPYLGTNLTTAPLYRYKNPYIIQIKPELFNPLRISINSTRQNNANIGGAPRFLELGGGTITNFNQNHIAYTIPQLVPAIQIFLMSWWFFYYNNPEFSLDIYQMVTPSIENDIRGTLDQESLLKLGAPTEDDQLASPPGSKEKTAALQVAKDELSKLDKYDIYSYDMNIEQSFDPDKYQITIPSNEQDALDVVIE
ncbi:hypothetical protein ACFE04_019773 [Oxalis oulophora]